MTSPPPSEASTISMTRAGTVSTSRTLPRLGDLRGIRSPEGSEKMLSGPLGKERKPERLELEKWMKSAAV